MAKDLPPDDKIQAHIEHRVRKVEDYSTLTRTILKDSIAKKFQLNEEQRGLLDSDPYYKKAIKGWIQDALTKRETEEEEEKEKKSSKKHLKRDSSTAKEEEDHVDDNVGDMSEFSELEDEEPKKKKPRQSKSSPSISTGPSSKSTTTAKSPTSTAEIKLKKLKGLVLLCGTRKPWKKIFEEAACPDEESADEDRRIKTLKKQATVVERILLDLGMKKPFTKQNADQIHKEKEIKQDLEAIQVANQTERSKTRNKTKEISTESQSEEVAEKVEPPPKVRKFNRSLADFAAELNDD